MFVELDHAIVLSDPNRWTFGITFFSKTTTVDNIESVQASEGPYGSRSYVIESDVLSFIMFE